MHIDSSLPVKDAQNFVLENLGAFIQYSFSQTLSLNDISLRLLSKTHSGEWVLTRFDEAQWRDVMMQRWLNNVPGEVIVISSKVSCRHVNELPSDKAQYIFHRVENPQA